MKSKIYQAQVHHQRVQPTSHEFTYSLLYYAFDLDELESLDAEHWFFGYNKPRFISLHDHDYLQAGQGSLKQKLLSRLEGKPYRDDIEHVVLVTSARFFNYTFNPVSFFYCYNAKSEVLAVAAEVNNTFGERHLYVLDHQTAGPPTSNLEFQANKRFHVSPFNDVSGHYQFRFSDLEKQLNIAIDLVAEGVTKMKTALRGEPLTFSGNNLLKAAMTDPLGTFLTLPRIHWEAFVLYFRKKLPFFSTPLPSCPHTHQVKRATLPQRLAQRLVMGALARIQNGSLVMRLPDGTETSVGQPSGTSLYVHIKSYRFFTRVIQSGDIGFGEAYVEGLFECDDVVSLLQLFLDNGAATINRSQPLLSALGRALNTLLHLTRRNTLRGSRQNISAHYDLSNPFFATFLDPSMTYSSGLFLTEDDDLVRAQEQKIDALIARAEIGSNDHVLEIGCGWGSFAIRAARQTGCRVTGVTLSVEQLEYARQKVREEGLESRIDLRLCDYRQVQGRYDKIVSIEMLEAVGHENQGTFLTTCDRLLKPGGKAAIQVITMADDHYSEYRRECDWIQRYIFPGGCLVSFGHLQSLVSNLTELSLDEPTQMGVDYARTLQLWRASVHASREQIMGLGFDERFLRMWHYYLCYCEAGFLSGPIDTIQFSLSK
jgi:cyclopropane-fatty-acyl-phospholipid synthase